MTPTKQTVYLPADGKSCDFIVRWYDDSYENDVKREEGYFFTPEQLNEYTANVIKQKLEFAIEQLNKLDSVLQSKYEILSNMQQEFLGKRKEEQLASKKSGLRLAKEEIRRDIKELEQKLSEL